MEGTSKAFYRRHKYSGPTKSRKRVRAQLKRHYGEDVSRVDVWRTKKNKALVESEEAKSTRPVLKTYSRQNSSKHVEATLTTRMVDGQREAMATTTIQHLEWKKLKESDVLNENQPNIDTVESKDVVLDAVNPGKSDPDLAVPSTSSATVTDPQPQEKKPRIRAPRQRKLVEVNPDRELRPKKPAAAIMFVDPQAEDTDSDSPDDSNDNEAEEDSLSLASGQENSNEEPETTADPTSSDRIRGHRIVNMNYFFNELVRVSSHQSKFKCGIKSMKLVSEDYCGLASIFKFKCILCKQYFKIGNSKKKLNKNAVGAAVAAGQDQKQLNSFLQRLELPTLSDSLYATVRAQVDNEISNFVPPEEGIGSTLEEEEVIVKEEPIDGDYEIHITYNT